MASYNEKTFWNHVVFEYDLDNNVTKISNTNFGIKYNYDTLQRIVNKNIENKYNIDYAYTDISDNKTTNQIKSIKNGNDEVLNYTYDKNGNIETISEGVNLKQKYYYDALGQLIRENNKEINKTIIYEYDTAGNILNKKEYAYTEGEVVLDAINTNSYTYGNTEWKDQLTKYNNKEITYDEIGNPLKYDTSIYAWENGRLLSKVSNEQTNETIRFKYNQDGIRIQKNDIKYFVRGDKVICARDGNKIYHYSYDEAGQPIGITKVGTSYEAYYRNTRQ